MINVRLMPYFKDLTDLSLLKEVAQAVKVESYERGQILFLEGDICRGLYYLASGQIRIFKSGAGGREQVLQLVNAGQTFNEVPVLDGESVPTSADALEPSLIWIVPTTLMLELIQREPLVARAILGDLASRLRYMTHLAGELSLKQVTARVAGILISQVEQEAILGIRISNKLTAQLTQQQMAAMAGTVREMVGRALRTLQKAGAIEPRRGHIIIKDVAKLQTFL